MSYVPLGDGRKDVHVENIELTTNIDGQSRYNYAPPPGGPSDGDSRYSYSGAHLAPQKSAIEKWPINSQQVATLTPLRGSILIFDVLLASCPLLFIILAIVVARLDGKSPLPNTNKLEEMLLYTPTVFPLLFAALMGRFFRHLGLWLAERGTTLGRLEQLVGCQSVFLAIERQICLRNFSIVGVCSILVWLLSPFGGQSALRVLRQETRYLNTTQTYHYLDPLNVEESVMGGASAINSGRSTFTPLFLAALLSSADFQVKPADLWGNVKLPSYRAIENTTAEEWKSVPSYKDNTVKWSSLIGIPVSAFNGQDFTAHSMNHFTVKARQFDISCTSNAEISRGPSTNASWPTISPWRLETAIEQPKNCTDGCKLKGCDAYPCPFNSTSMTDTGSDTETASRAECEYSYEYVEASVECIGSLCRAISMRKLDMYTDGYSEDSDDFLRGVVMYNLMTTLSSVDTIGVAAARVRGSTNMEAWLMDPENFIGATGGVNVDLYQLPVDVFADRLTILWNTFFQATYASRALAGNLDKATSMNITDNLGTNITFNSTQSLVSQRVDVYRVNWRWFSVLLGCSLVLLCAAYAGLVLKYLSIAPDIVGYASSLTLLSPYVPTPTGGTTLHGLERTALLHNLPIRLGDVCPNDPVGAIALAANDGRVVGLDRRRQYI